jgi:hypothetical protein
MTLPVLVVWPNLTARHQMLRDLCHAVEPVVGGRAAETVACLPAPGFPHGVFVGAASDGRGGHAVMSLPAAAELDVHPATVYRAISSGRSRALRVGMSRRGAIRVPADESEAFKARFIAGEVTPPNEAIPDRVAAAPVAGPISTPLAIGVDPTGAEQ